MSLERGTRPILGVGDQKLGKGGTSHYVMGKGYQNSLETGGHAVRKMEDQTSRQGKGYQTGGLGDQQSGKKGTRHHVRRKGYQSEESL